MTDEQIKKVSNLRLCGAHMYTWTTREGFNYYNYETEAQAIAAAREHYEKGIKMKPEE